MSFIDKFYAWLLNHFLPKDEFDPNKVTCSIDGKQVSCETWEEN